METVDTLVCARWVLPVEGETAVLDRHAVAIRAGRVVTVLPEAEARARYVPHELVERPHHALMPGLVNAHTQAAMSLLRGRAECLPLGPWLDDAVRPVTRRWVGPEYVRDGTELGIVEMLRGGVTTFADMHPWPEIVARTAAELHIRASVGLIVADEVTPWASGAGEGIEKGMALRDEYRGDPLVDVHFAPLVPWSMADATLLRIRRLADELEVPIAMQLHESRWEVEQSLARHGVRPLTRLARLGLANPLLVAIHVTQVDEDDLDTLATAGTAVVHCPESNLRFGNGACPAASLLGRGVRVGLGTDGAASNNDLDVFAEMRCAGLLAAGISGTPGALVAHDLLRMATLEGARALGLGESTGSLVPGKWADLCCIDLRAPRSWPVHDVATSVVYACSSQQVTDTWVAGRHVVAEGTLRYIDEHAVLDRAEAWRARIDADHGGSEVQNASVEQA